MKQKTRYILLLVVLAAIVGAIFYFENLKATPIVEDDTEEDPMETELKEGLYPKAPEIVGASAFLNTNGEFVKIEDLRGKVVLIDFWTYSCVNCIRTLPFLTDWHSKYSDKGLVIIGVHTPEFEFEKDTANVLDAIDRHGIEYAVVQDNNYATWTNYKNRFWPRKYLIDGEGFIRYDHIGEGAYEETELKIQELLAELGEDVSDTQIKEGDNRVLVPLTPELYAGYDFALNRDQNLGNQEGFRVDEPHYYKVPTFIESDVIYLEGEWKSNPGDLTLTGDEGSIVLQFTGQEVNIVADVVDSGGMEVEVLIDGIETTADQGGDDVRFGNERSYVLIDKPRLYHLFKGKYDTYRLELKIPDEGFSFNAFTFG